MTDYTDRIKNGGVKQILVTETQDPDFCLVRIIDNEGCGEELKRFVVSKNENESVPTVVEDALSYRYDMGPTWFWSVTAPGRWEGQFAHYTNRKYSDKFAWGNKEGEL